MFYRVWNIPNNLTVSKKDQTKKLPPIYFDKIFYCDSIPLVPLAFYDRLRQYFDHFQSHQNKIKREIIRYELSFKVTLRWQCPDRKNIDYQYDKSKQRICGVKIEKIFIESMFYLLLFPSLMEVKFRLVFNTKVLSVVVQKTIDKFRLLTFC